MKQKTYVGFMWQCSCGHVEYSDENPEECSSCGQMDSFVKLPEEIVEERLKEDDDLISDAHKNVKNPRTEVRGVFGFLNTSKIDFAFSRTKVESLRKINFLSIKKSKLNKTKSRKRK